MHVNSKNFNLPPLIALLLMFVVYDAFAAGRTSKSVPLTAKAYGTSSASAWGPKGVTVNHKFSCVNLSAYPQNLVIRYVNKKLECSAAKKSSSLPPLSWVADTVNVGWFYKSLTEAQTAFPASTTLLLPPNADGSLTLASDCPFRSGTGAPSCASASQNYSLPGAYYQFQGALCSFNFRIEVQVAEDRGSVLCSAYSEISLPYSEKIETQHSSNYDFNGGRPF
jgi:hypothetical protein